MSDWAFEPTSTNAVMGGIQYRFKFGNGYGASVVRHEFSYGGNVGLWELAVTDEDGDLTYDTPVTDDVLGRLSVGEVNEALREISELPQAVAA